MEGKNVERRNSQMIREIKGLPWRWGQTRTEMQLIMKDECLRLMVRRNLGNFWGMGSMNQHQNPEFGSENWDEVTAGTSITVIQKHFSGEVHCVARTGESSVDAEFKELCIKQAFWLFIYCQENHKIPSASRFLSDLQTDKHARNELAMKQK